MMIKAANTIVHLTSAHPRFDTRIFRLMCKSLADDFNRVFIVCGDQRGIQRSNRVAIVGVCNPFRYRLARVLMFPLFSIRSLIRIRPAIVHIHDPELLLFSPLLKLILRCRIVFDAHEDYPKDVMNKSYLGPPLMRAFVSWALWGVMKASCRVSVSWVVAATPVIAESFRSSKIKSADVKNYSSLEGSRSLTRAKSGPFELAYLGAATADRGFPFILDVVASINSEVTLNLIGEVSEYWRKYIEQHDSKNRVVLHGFMSPTDYAKILTRCSLGIVYLREIETFQDSIPIKLCEYLASGLPVVGSNLRVMKGMLEKYDIGRLSPYGDVDSASRVIEELLRDEEMLTLMSRRARLAAEREFNWGVEYRKLREIYNQVLSGSGEV